MISRGHESSLDAESLDKIPRMNSTDLPIAILAGGLATRMQPLTSSTPKALLPIAGKPFIRHQLELLHKNGAQRIVLCLGYLGEQIEKEIGNGETLGLEVSYSYDGPKLLGTGGALIKALPQLGDSFFVLYGDSYLPIPLSPIARKFISSGKLGLMTVYKNEGLYDSSNVWFEDGEIQVYDKKTRVPQMQHIDYGLGLLDKRAFATFSTDAPFDLADVYRKLLAMGELSAYEALQRFYEIGSPAGLQELNQLLGNKKS